MVIIQIPFGNCLSTNHNQTLVRPVLTGREINHNQTVMRPAAGR